MRKNRNILLVMSFYFDAIHRGVAQFASENGWHLNSKMTIDGCIPWGWQGDGLIIQRPRNPEVAQFINSFQIPKVSMGLYKEEIPSIVDDFDGIGRVASDYFLRKGFNNFCVYYEYGTVFPRELASFIKAVNKVGKHCSIISPPVLEMNWQKKSLWLANKLKEMPKPLALFTARDNAGAEVIDACLGHQLKVPSEIAVLGKHNNTLVCNSLAVPLSSVDNNLERMGYSAAEMLEKTLRGECVERVVVNPVCGVVSRMSTDILAIEHPKIRKALSYIHKNFLWPISVTELAEACGFSVRGLQLAFVKETGQNIFQEVIRLRIEHSKVLLSQTNRTVELIANHSGFSSQRNFYTQFKKLNQMTPKQYRILNSARKKLAH